MFKYVIIHTIDGLEPGQLSKAGGSPYQSYSDSTNNIKLPEIVSEHVHGKLVCCHHDGGVGYLSDQLCSQPSVQAPVALLPPNQEQGLPE